ncbi:class I SAM-dependent methyltransferase [Tsukamurella paurometabola]|uniref:C-methyltransferase C-terminal domain n=1 Tax=Tsukamurella paurometabola TaxID=2061 RepID=A0A3P8L5W5_TSUPA|nr:methyltransferase domain-containing protein [Tsukamurella paurometabola]MBS4103483.1 methyltransferase domain-containing protein [Tsukamurella paurometabola]UEA81350.1 methyltransferase C-terminal domain-containing protein [Tsukamurella paurometabola]VDR38331.1 C-methyltransferase C-terminal domain [Tsukamurella paurometabola]
MRHARACRGCGSVKLTRVLDLGRVPAADFFPPAGSPVDPGESSHPLAMDLCAACGLAQLADDDTVADEPRGVEPRALREQAADAVARVAEAGLLRGTTVREFGSPHGGTWLPLLADRGFREAAGAADVVLDSFGIMHEPDQRAAFAARAAAVAPGGVLLLQYQPLGGIVEHLQWTALRHGHFGYYTLTALLRLLAAAGLEPVRAFEFDLYGGTVLLAVRHAGAADVVPGPGTADPTVRRILAAEAEAGLGTPAGVRTLSAAPADQARALREWAQRHAAAGRPVAAYGAASRAVALFALAGLDTALVTCVADASPSKQGRRMPGTDIPIVAPDHLGTLDGPVLLTLPDLHDEVLEAWPALRGRLVTQP